MRGLLTLSLLLVTSTAAADDPQSVTRASLGEGYDLVIDKWNAHVVKGKQRARLTDGISIAKVTVDKTARKVAAKLVDSSCNGETEHTWTYAHLQARLDNTAAYTLHKKKDYKTAAAGFAKAVAADPAWKIPAVNLASAHQLLGDKDAAVKALAPWLASEPIAMYVQTAVDPEIAPLLDRPELGAIRAAKPGDVKLTQSEVTGGAAYDATRKLLVVARTERSWGACVYQTDLEIYDTTNGTLVAATPIVRFDETSPDCETSTSGVVPKARKAVAARVVMLQKMLRDLGFKKLTTEAGTEPRWDENGTKRTSSIKKAKLGVVAADGVARVFQKNTQLGTGGVLEAPTNVLYIKELDTVVVWSLRPGAEGCEGTDPTAVSIIPLTRTAGVKK